MIIIATEVTVTAPNKIVVDVMVCLNYIQTSYPSRSTTSPSILAINGLLEALVSSAAKPRDKLPHIDRHGILIRANLTN